MFMGIDTHLSLVVLDRGLRNWTQIRDQNNNLQGRFTELMTNLNEVADHLQNGNYAGNEGDIDGMYPAP